VKRVLAGLAVGVLAAAVPASSAEPPVTIGARPRVLPSYLSSGAQPLELFGALANGRAGELITIRANECTLPGWYDATTATTEAGGAWHVTWSAASKTTFRAKWRSAVSAGVTVQTRPAVDLNQLGPTRWQVGVRPRFFAGRKGHLQRFDANARRWREVKAFRLSSTRAEFGWTFARFKAVVPVGAQVRAVVPRSSGKPCFLAGYSFIMRKR
jgi:hypothetical protein